MKEGSRMNARGVWELLTNCVVFVHLKCVRFVQPFLCLGSLGL